MPGNALCLGFLIMTQYSSPERLSSSPMCAGQGVSVVPTAWSVQACPGEAATKARKWVQATWRSGLGAGVETGWIAVPDNIWEVHLQPCEPGAG
jgi:hypothetical protein